MLKDILCVSCGHLHSDVYLQNPQEAKEFRCVSCDSPKVELLFSVPANYTIKGDNSASTRPKYRGKVGK